MSTAFYSETREVLAGHAGGQMEVVFRRPIDVARNCGTCRHKALSVSDQPCVGCSRMLGDPPWTEWVWNERDVV